MIDSWKLSSPHKSDALQACQTTRMRTRDRSSMPKCIGKTVHCALPMAEGKSSAKTSGVQLPKLAVDTRKSAGEARM